MQKNRRGYRITPENRKKMMAGTGQSEESMIVTEAIYNFLKDNNITLKSVCVELKLNENGMCRTMNFYRPMNLQKAIKICRHLGISLDEVYGIVPRTSKESESLN